jgi:hypothetical protein
MGGPTRQVSVDGHRSLRSAPAPVESQARQERDIAHAHRTLRPGDTSQGIVINPTGQEDESHLILQLPNDACLPGATCTRVLGQAPALAVDGVSVTLGASTRLVPGVHSVAVNTLGGQVTTVAGQTLTLTLPIADAKCVAAGLPNVPPTDFGGAVKVSNAACPTTVQGSATGVPLGPANMSVFFDSGCSSNDSFSGRVAGGTVASMCTAVAAQYGQFNLSYHNAQGTCVTVGSGYAGCVAAEEGLSGWVPGVGALTEAYEAYPPGTLTATVSGGTPQSLTVNAGDEVDFDIDLPAIGTVPATFATDISFLTSRVNPDASRGTITSSCAGDRTYTIPSSPAATALALTAFVAPACTYTLNVGGRTATLSQAQTNSISLNRVDVDNVTITREDGTTYTTTGTWTLNFGGVQVVGPFSTGTGVDVLPGTYEFSLSYTDFNGPQTSTQTLTL